MTTFRQTLDELEASILSCDIRYLNLNQCKTEAAVCFLSIKEFCYAILQHFNFSNYNAELQSY